jgi:hypothetical protein
MTISPAPLRSIFTLAIILVGTPVAFATDIYVDNRIGDDLYDGSSPQQIDDRSGPVRTIGRALEKVQPRDIVHVANHGMPYVESLAIVGPRFGKFILEGNGAVVSGARVVPYDAWQRLGHGVWRFTPRRKAFYQLIDHDQALSETPVSRDAQKLPELPEGNWCAWRGSIYYRVLSGPGGPNPQSEVPLAFAAEEVGITLLDADDVVIRNLELRHFRLDGINVHDRCQNVLLDNVRLIENGRAGLAVGGASLVGIKDSELRGNRVTQVLNAEVAQTEILDCKLGPAPGGLYQRKGGHVLIDEQDMKE